MDGEERDRDRGQARQSPVSQYDGWYRAVPYQRLKEALCTVPYRAVPLQYCKYEAEAARRKEIESVIFNCCRVKRRLDTVLYVRALRTYVLNVRYCMYR
jgi:hypothetical protein